MACGDGRCGRCDRLVDTLERVRAMPVPKDEETAKVKIILPVLAALGWDPAGDDVILEFQVGAVEARGRGKRFVDIALAPEPDRPVALIEAKAPRQDLGRNVNQVLQQAFFGPAKISVLTNGRIWWFYLPRADGEPHERRFAEFDLHDDRLEELAEDLKTFLGREALLDGSAVKRALFVLAARHAGRLSEQLPGLWQELSGRSADNEPHPTLLQVITKLVYDRTGQRPTPEQVASMLRCPPCDETTADPDDPDDPPPPATSPSPPHGPPPEDPSERCAAKLPRRRKGQRAPRPTVFVLRGARHRVTYWYQVPVRVAEFVAADRPNDFDRIGELPFATKTPRGKRHFKRVDNTDWYLDTNRIAETLIDHARQVLKHFYPVDPPDLQVCWHDPR